MLAGSEHLLLDLAVSNPQKLNQGDPLTLLDQPQKLEAGGLWELVVWELTIPYTSGANPA